MQSNIAVIKSAIKADVPVLLEGHTGTGKTYMIMQLAKEQNKQLHVINVSGELTVDSILGQQTLVDGNVSWRDGVLAQAMKSGDWVLFDEMNTALPEVLTVINGVLDDSRSVTLPNADNERVSAHKDFRFIGTQNPSSGQYAGTGRLNDALLNRMIRVTVGYMESEREIEALKTHTKLADSSISALVSIAHYTRRERWDSPISTRDLVKIVRLRDRGGMTIKEATSSVLADKYDDSQYRELEGYFSDKMSELKRYAGYSDKDPIDYIRGEWEKLNTAKAELEKSKRDIRGEVKRELLHNLLTGESGATTNPLPKDL